MIKHHALPERHAEFCLDLLKFHLQTILHFTLHLLHRTLDAHQFAKGRVW